MVSWIKGDPPNLLEPPPGCGFAPRCDVAGEACASLDPALIEVEAGHLVRCHLASRGV